MYKGKYQSRELKKYFRKSGNKYLFLEKWSLNQLAGEMDANTDLEVDAGLLSKAIAGDRPLQDWLLDAFVAVLGLTEAQRWDLEYAVVQDQCIHAGSEIHLGVAPPTLIIVTNNLSRIQQARDDGSLQLAFDMLYELYQWKCELDAVDSVSPLLLRILSLLQQERQNVMAAIAQSQWSGKTNLIDYVDLASEQELIEKLYSSEHRPLLSQIVHTTAPLSDIERQIWQMRYQDQLSVEEIASKLKLDAATIQSLLLMAQEKVIADIREVDKSPSVTD